MDANSKYYEGCGQEGPIRCIFLCEFHPTAGPKITCQVPENYISKDIFDTVSHYIIPKVQLQRCTLTVTLLGSKILGFPVRIDNKKYARNAFYFNLCFVCDAWARTVHLEPLVKKLTEYLLSMELETEWLSKQSISGEANALGALMRQVMQDINSRRMCTLTVGTTTTHLTVVRVNSDPAPVKDHQVPVFLYSQQSFVADQWDLTTNQILPYIDGFNHVSKIAALTDVEISLVRACVQNLVYYGVVTLVPIFQYCAVYSATPKLRQLTRCAGLQRQCVEFCARSYNRGLADLNPISMPKIRQNLERGMTLCVELEEVKETSYYKIIEATKKARQLPKVSDLFRMYAGMTYGSTVRDLCRRVRPQELAVDERKLVLFGVLEGLIRRVYKVSDLFRMYAGMTYGSTVRDLCRRVRPQELAVDERKLVLFGVLEGLIRRVYKVSDLFRMYAGMTYGSTVRDLCRRVRPQELAVDERKLVLFGVLEGLIRRVYKVSDLFRMYAGMTYGSTVRDLCRRVRPQELAVDERKLVLFGVLEGLIRRVYKVSDLFRMYAGMTYGSTVRDLCRRVRPQELAVDERKLVLFGVLEGLIRRVYKVSDLFRMYAGMTYGSTVRDLCRRVRPQELAVDERKLVLFGVLEGLIRRVYKYPITMHDSSICEHSQPLVRTYNGLVCLDELCCQGGLTAQQLEEQLERDTNVVFIVK